MASHGRGALEMVYQWTWKSPKKLAPLKKICPEYY